MNVGDKVRVLPDSKHPHSNRSGVVVWSNLDLPGGFDVCVELVSPTRRPSLTSYTGYLESTMRPHFFDQELMVIA